MNYLKRIPYQVFLFLVLWGCLILFINDRNTVAYGLQSNGIKSLTERGTFYIEQTLGSNIEYYTKNSTWDLFEYKGHVYLAKQPGQFFIASFLYFFLNKLGITYEKNYVLTCGLISIFTSILMVAIMMVLVFNIVFYIVKNKKNALLTTCFFGFGTLILPYSGIVQHDIYATFFLLLGFYLLFKKYHLNKNDSKKLILLSGLCTGISLFNSYSAFTLILVILLYVLLHKNLIDIVLFISSLALSISLCFIFNFINFDNAFKFPIQFYTEFHNQINELTLKGYLSSIKERISQYIFSKATGITFYSPIYILGFVGFSLLPKKYNIEKYILPLGLLFAIIQPSLHGVLPNYGGCQYGPRYLIETIPFILIGLSGFFVKGNKKLLNKYKFLFPLILLVGVTSIVISAVGSMNVIYCGYYENGFINYIKKIIAGDVPNYYMFPIGLIIIFFSSIFLAYRDPIKIKKSYNN